MTAQQYVDQVSLLVRAIPEIAREDIFALKGGTAINLFVRDLPRVSVDIDLVYLPIADRDSSLQAVRDGLDRIASRLERGRRMAVERRLLPDGKRLVVQSDGVTIKIEVSPVLRGTVFSPVLRTVNATVEERFGFAEMQLVSEADSKPERSWPRSIASTPATCSTSTSCSSTKGSATISSRPS